LPRRPVDLLRPSDRCLARLRVHMLAVLELFGDDVELLDILEPIWPFSGPQANDATDDLGRPLQQDETAGDRNSGLEVVDGRPSASRWNARRSARKALRNRSRRKRAR